MHVEEHRVERRVGGDGLDVTGIGRGRGHVVRDDQPAGAHQRRDVLKTFFIEPPLDLAGKQHNYLFLLLFY